MSTVVIALENVVMGEPTDEGVIMSARTLDLGMQLAKLMATHYRVVFATTWNKPAEVERWLLDRGADFHWEICSPPAWNVPTVADTRAWQVQWQRSGGGRVALYLDHDPTACAAVRALGVPVMLFAPPTGPPPIEIGPPRAWTELVRETDDRLLGGVKDPKWEKP